MLYEIAQRIPMQRLRRQAGARMQRFHHHLVRHAVWAVALVRLVPVAPYSIVCLLLGTTAIRRAPYIAGTVLGMLPGIVVNAFFIDRVIAAIRHPSMTTAALLALAVLAIAALAMLVRRHFAERVMRLIVATYNTHGGIGIDRRFDPQRIADVIGELNADVIALQELEFHAHANMLDILRERTGFHAIAQRTFAREHGAFGNGLLSRWPMHGSTPIDLSLPGREPRGAIDATIDCDGTPLRVVATHLGLRPAERAEQARRLVEAVGRDARPTLLAGDINEWLMPRRALRALHAHFGESPARATFPSRGADDRARSHLDIARFAAAPRARAPQPAGAARVGSSAARRANIELAARLNAAKPAWRRILAFAGAPAENRARNSRDRRPCAIRTPRITVPRRRCAAVLFTAAVLLAACSSMRTSYVKAYSAAFDPPKATATAQYVANKTADHEGESGFRLLSNNSDAMMSRVVLADKAAKSIDLQYYIFDADATGKLIAQRLLAAADRGVRVRLLVDDLDAGDAEHMLDALDAHPNIEVRLFNPFHTRNPSVLSKIGQFIIDGPRLNRRMHNKSFIVDNTVAIVGGRNIGDAYFEAGGTQHFRDLDVIAIGPVVAETSRAFDVYWNDKASVPVKAFDTTKADGNDVDHWRQRLQNEARAAFAIRLRLGAHRRAAGRTQHRPGRPMVLGAGAHRRRRSAESRRRKRRSGAAARSRNSTA